MLIDKQKIEVAVRQILEALGADPDRPGLVETPKRVAGMYAEVFQGMNYTNEQIAEMFDKCFVEEDINTNLKDVVLVKDIPTFSYCEHHLALMYNMKVSVAYIPEGKVIGLSKISRIVDMVSKRLQLQERIGADVADCISKVVGTENVAVVISGEHACMTSRGIKRPGITVTSTLRGSFMEETALRSELYSMLK